MGNYRLEPLSCNFSGWFYAVTGVSFIFLSGFCFGLHFGEKRVLNALRKSEGPWKAGSTANLGLEFEILNRGR